VARPGSSAWAAGFKCFRLKSEAENWARETETAIIAGKSAKAVRVCEKTTFARLIDRHIDDMREVGKSPRRSKRKSLEAFFLGCRLLRHVRVLRKADDRSADRTGE
jgi:hypothetical protein